LTYSRMIANYRVCTDLRGIYLSLNDVEYGNVAVLNLLVLSGRHHHVLWLQQPPHHVEHGRLAHRGVVRVGRERRVARHEKVEVGRRDEGRDQADKVVVHVGRVAQRRRAHRHDGRDKLVDLGGGW
jgi:hypothetical protein